VEVRGALPEEITCPETGVTFKTGTAGGTVPKKSHFACGACGADHDVLKAIKASGKSGPVAAYAMQGYCPACDREKQAYRGRFFAPCSNSSSFDAADKEWKERKEADLAPYWPRSELPYGFMTHKLNGGIPNHGFTHWWTMFNPRQLLVHAQLLQAIAEVGGETHRWAVRELVLGAFQQYLRNQNMFCFWNHVADKMEPMFSNANYHPKATVIENCVFADYGRGNWDSDAQTVLSTLDWIARPWDLVSNARLAQHVQTLAGQLTGKSEKAFPQDPVTNGAVLECRSATDLAAVADASHHLVITDPPFGGNLHYAELADFFYVWLRLVLKDHYPDLFGPEYTPKTLEAVANRARQPEDPDGYYQRLLTACWREGHRILKPGGLLAFTFHHSEDAPWVAVLESLFDAGFYLEATYPIRADESKGKGEFGSKKIEYDIIHVCRKRRQAPTAVSWAKMRREVLREVRQLQGVLEHHQKEGLGEADLRVIRRGKALEYFSRHYGRVYVDEGQTIGVADAIVGINQLLDEEAGTVADPPPVVAEPFTRQFLRLFDGQMALPRDQIQKFLRGTGIAPSDYEERGWCIQSKKIYRLIPPLEIARRWHGRHREKMAHDYDQAAFFIGACIDGSGINASDTLNNDRFKPHPALGALLEWFAHRGATPEVRSGAARAHRLYRSWQENHRQQQQQMALFFGGEG